MFAVSRYWQHNFPAKKMPHVFTPINKSQMVDLSCSLKVPKTILNESVQSTIPLCPLLIIIGFNQF